MGLIWNTAATQAIIHTLLLEFSGDASLAGALGDKPPISRWQKTATRDVFKPANSHELKDIAANNGLYGGGSAGSPNDVNWQAWLGALGNSGHSASQHEKLRKLIYDGLDPTKYAEIVFSVIPRKKTGALKVYDAGDATNADGTVAKVIQIETPTAQAVQARIERIRRAAAAAEDKAVALRKSDPRKSRTS